MMDEVNPMAEMGFVHDKQIIVEAQGFLTPCDSIRNLVVEEKMSFADAARSFSEEKHSATSGGLMADEYSGSSYFEKDQLKPADYNVLRNMKEGEVSEPFESLDNEGRSGNTIYKILYLEKVIPAHVATFKEDYNTLLEEVNQKNSLAAIDKFIEEKQKTTYIVIDPDDACRAAGASRQRFFPGTECVRGKRLPSGPGRTGRAV